MYQQRVFWIESRVKIKNPLHTPCGYRWILHAYGLPHFSSQLFSNCETRYLGRTRERL
jgi:hypothetical protein